MRRASRPPRAASMHALGAHRHHRDWRRARPTLRIHDGLDEIIFLLRLAALGGRNQPAWHTPPPGPGVLGILGIAVFNGDRPFPLPAFAEDPKLENFNHTKLNGTS